MYIKHNIESVSLHLKNNDYILLSNTYDGIDKKLDMKCPKGHTFKLSYHSFQQGHRCIQCATKVRGDSQRLKFEDVKEYIESFDYKLLSTEYINTLTKLELKCSEGHIYNTTYNGFKGSKRCPICFGTPKKTLEEVKDYIESFSYTLLSTEYKNCMSKLKFRCLKNHNFKMIYNNFQQGQRCPLCANSEGKSKPEKEIIEYIKTIYTGLILENDRTQIKNFWSNRNLELDIYLPDISKAIEYNGFYWHNKNESIKWKDEMKKKQCIQKGIDLLIIDENDWINDKDRCLNIINEFVRY